MKIFGIIFFLLWALRIDGCCHTDSWQTSRCLIRPSRITDAKKVYNLLTNEQVAKYQYDVELNAVDVERIKTIRYKWRVLVAFSNLFSNFGKRWIIENKESHEFIGCVGFSPEKPTDYSIDSTKKCFNIGIAFKPEYWNQKFCSEMGTFFLEKLSMLKEGVYIISTNPQNEAVQKIAKKLQFEDKGVRRIENGNRIIRRPFSVKIFTKEINKA